MDNPAQHPDITPEIKGLSKLQIDFSLEYYRLGNATQAAKAAGYDGDRPNKWAYDQLQKDKVKRYIEAISKTHEEYAEFHKGQFVNVVRMIATTTLKDFMDGNWETLKDINDIPEEKMHAIQEVKVQKIYNREGDHIRTNTTLKLVDKHKWFDLLSKLKNYYADHNNTKKDIILKIV